MLTLEAVEATLESSGIVYTVERKQVRKHGEERVFTHIHIADTFEFETAFPHRLVRWDRSDGGSLRLADSRRFRYWEKNAPGDERFLQPPVTR